MCGKAITGVEREGVVIQAAGAAGGLTMGSKGTIQALDGKAHSGGGKRARKNERI